VVEANPSNADAVVATEPPADPGPDQWLQMARDAYEQSSDWFDTSLRPTIEKAMAHFNNRHAPGSKYYSDAYKYRHKGFRPKTRASIRRNEAAGAVAFFSTQDMVSITAENEAEQQQLITARILTELLNYRLDDSIPWFQILLGALQDALNVGVCISHQDWHFHEITEKVSAGPNVFDQAGNPAMKEVTDTLADKPRVSLVAIENFRISPASDWANPIGSSPYVVESIPMFIGDIKEQMASGRWMEYTDGEIAAAAQTQYDTIRQARDGTKRTDAKDVNHATTAFDTVWVHRNIIRHNGDDVIFYTLGTHLRLSDPVPLRQEYRNLARGERPYVMGSVLIEAHKAFVAGLNELTFGLQEETNEIQNQRRDNVSLVMNKRYFARRTANIDYRSLTRNVPGSITLMDDINSDLKWDSPGEVTGSSYQEQDRVSLDYDELAGTFSPGSVQSNRQLNETVGGMKMLAGDANVVTEYQLRVFAETWVEPVLKQLVLLEQAYETDQKVLAIAGQKAELFDRFGISAVNDELLQGLVKVRVNVGFGATNPQQRVEKIAMGLDTIGKFLPQLMIDLDGKEVVTEVFGALGFKGAERFFPKLGKAEDPQVSQLKQMVQQLQQALQGKQAEIDGRIKVAQITTSGRIQQEQIRQFGQSEQAQLRAEAEFALAKMEAELGAIDRQLESQRNQIDVARLHNERAALIGQMHAKRRELDNAELQPNPTGAMSTTLANDRYNRVPGAVG